MHKNDELTALLANRLTPTNDQVRDWLQSPQIKQWLTQQMMGIPNTIKAEMINTIIKNIALNPDNDCRAHYGNSAIGVDVLRFLLWASYRLPYGSKIKTPNCPYTLNTVRLKGKGERGKVSNTSFTPYPLTFSQTTREVHTAYPNRIAYTLEKHLEEIKLD